MSSTLSNNVDRSSEEDVEPLLQDSSLWRLTSEETMEQIHAWWGVLSIWPLKGRQPRTGEDHVLYHTWGSCLILVGEVCFTGRSQLGVILPNIGQQVLCQILLLGRNPNIQTWWDFLKSECSVPTVVCQIIGFEAEQFLPPLLNFFIIFLCLLSAYMPHSPHEVSGSDLHSPGIWSYQ